MSAINISVDGQQHIRKLSQRYLPEREMVLLEWVRFARLRNAGSIEISLRPDQTVIIDDGRAVPQAMLQAMRTLLESDDADEIERSIEALKPLRGIGILCPLAAQSSGFVIRSPGPGGMTALSHGSKIPEKTGPGIEGRTSLILGSRGANLTREREILRLHLPMVNARISLDNETIPHRSHGRDSFLSLRLYQGEVPVGTLSLPRSSNHSTIELCHGDIPWRLVHFPARQGRIFWARLESVLNEDELGPMMAQMEEANLRLLRYLCDNTEKWGDSLRGRIEELLFEWSRATAPDFPIEELPLFRISGQEERVSLAWIREKSLNGPLTAIIVDHDKDSASSGSGILLLTRKQADFISRSALIPLNFSGSPSSRTFPLIPIYLRFLHQALQGLDRFLSRLLSRRGPAGTDAEEDQILIAFLTGSRDWSRFADPARYRLELIEYKGFWPSHLHAREKKITIHKGHLITRALRNAVSEKRPFSLLVKALVPPEFS